MLNDEVTEQERKQTIMLRIILISIVLLILITIGIILAIMYLQESEFKVYIDGASVSITEDLFIIEEDTGTVYVSMKDVAKLVEYEYHNGEYKVNSEDTDKGYVENEDETASFFLNSNKISKVEPNTTNDYDNYTIDEPVKSINNKLYVSSDGLEIACNLTFTYNKEKNTITIQTLPYLIAKYETTIVNYGYNGISEEFKNQKAILYNMFVVQNTSGKYAVIDVYNEEIIGAKYSNIEFSENTKEFFVTNTQNQVGILLSNGIAKISLSYEEIKVLDREFGLYIVKKNTKYGVVDKNENTIIYPEYDSIGIDVASFPIDNIENQYLLFNKVIPVKRNNLWGLFDTNGNIVLKVEYDALGCANPNVTEVANGVLLIPDYEGIVVLKDNLYGIYSASGKELIPMALDTVYGITSSGENTYYMIYTDPSTEKEHTMNVIEYIEQS